MIFRSSKQLFILMASGLAVRFQVCFSIRLINIQQMIVRGLRSHSRIKGDEHRFLEKTLDQVRTENKELRMDVLRLQQRLLESQQSKRKYKTKYRQAKQKIEILELVGLYAPKQIEHYNCCNSPRTKTTRIKTASEQEFHSIKGGFPHSELAEDNYPTKPYLPENDEYQIASKKTLTPATTFREDSREDAGILQSLMKVHQQLQKLSEQIQKTNVSPKVHNFQSQLYQKMEQVVDKLNQMEVRTLEREKERESREKQRMARRHNSSMKAVQQIGRNLMEFKVDE